MSDIASHSPAGPPHLELPRLRRVTVGTTNPVKIAAVRAILARVAPSALVSGLAVPSGVPDQPWGDDETIAGARNRARAVLAETDAELAIGLEGGVVAQPDGQVRTCAWAVACTRDGREGIGGSLVMPLPASVAERLRRGEELGHAMDAEARVQGTKHGLGAVGILTAGLFDRQQAYEPLVAYALAPWLAASFYDPSRGA
jgi:inosine/xanthosine triphosphatase